MVGVQANIGSRCRKRCQYARTARSARSGFSLLEVLLALAILVGGVLTASRLIDIGLEEADLSRAQNLAVLLAESKLAEIEAGLTTGSVSDSGEYEDHPGFKYAVETASTDVDGVTAVTVTIGYQARGRETDYKVVRWLHQSSDSGRIMR